MANAFSISEIYHKRRLMVAVAICGGFLAQSVSALEPLPEPTAEEWGRLQAGEVVVGEWKGDESGGAVLVRAVMNARASEIWDIVGSCDQAFVFVDGLRECESLERDSTHAVMSQRVKKHWLIPSIEFEFMATWPDAGHIQFELIKGDLKSMRGDWTIEELEGEGQVLISHRLQMKPRWPAPKWLVRRTMARDMPDMLACVRGLVGGSASAPAVQSDLARCAGETQKED